jgi:hypothetical protein
LEIVMITLATIGTLGLIALGGILSLGASLITASMLRRKTEAPLPEESNPLTQRGSFVPLIIGRRRVAPVFAWVGDRKVKKSGGGGGKGGGGGGGAETTTYRESAWHVLAVGPLSRLDRIMQAGKQIWPNADDPIGTYLDPSTSPSGTTVVVKKHGSFKIYWGEDDQPVDDDLAEFIGVASRWPKIAYVLWIGKALGGQPTWPTLSYDIVAEEQSSLVDADGWISASVGAAVSAILRPADDISSDWKPYNSAAYSRIDDEVEDPSDPSDADYLFTSGVPGADAEFLFSALKSVDEVSQIVVKIHTVTIGGGSYTVKLKIGSTYTNAQTVSSGEDGWVALTFNVSSDASLFPATYAEINAVRVKIEYDGTSSASSARIDAMYLSVTYTPVLEDDGVNPAHALWQVLTSPYPYGCGIAEAEFDKDSFEDLAALFATETLAFNSAATEGSEASKVISEMLLDCNTAIVMNSGLLYANPYRRPEAGQVKILTDDLIVGPDMEVTVFTAEATTDNIVFVYKDRANGFRDTDHAVSDDSLADMRGGPSVHRVNMMNVIDSYNAAKIAEFRMQQELSKPNAVKFTGTRGMITAIPGDLIARSGFGTMRVLSVKRDSKTSKVEIQGVTEPFDVEPSQFIFVPTDPTAAEPAVNDTTFKFIELPFGMTPVAAIGVLRARANEEIDGAVVHISVDDSAYYQVGFQNATAVAVMLTTALDSGTDTIIEEGPSFSPLNGGDVDEIQDLSGDEPTWRSGRQVLFIGNEIILLQSVSPNGDGTYAMEGLIRARYDTEQESHATEAVGFIVDIGKLFPIRDVLVDKNNIPDLYVKTQPFTSSEIADVSAVNAFHGELIERFNRPLKPDNFRANDDGLDFNVYSASDDIVFTWDYRVKIGRGGSAGELPAGTPVVSEPDPEDFFRIEIYDEEGGTLKRTIDVTGGAVTHTYTNANVITDFGSEPSSLFALIYQFDGSLSSPSEGIVITKV